MKEYENHVKIGTQFFGLGETYMCCCEYGLTSIPAGIWKLNLLKPFQLANTHLMRNIAERLL